MTKTRLAGLAGGLRLGAAALIGFAVLGCARREAAKPAAAHKPMARVHVNFTPSLSSAPLAIARDEGFFRAEGIDASLDVIDINSATLMLAEKKIDVFGGPIRPGLFNVMTKGTLVQVVADKGHSGGGACVPEAFVAPEHVAERLSRNDFTNLRIAAGIGSLGHYLASRFLAQHHADPSTVDFVQTPRGGDFLDRGSHAIEAVRYLTEPNLSNALRNPHMKVVATTESIAPGHQLAVLMYGPRLLHDDRDLGRRFMRAYLRGVRQYNQGKTPRNVEIIASYTKLPKALIETVCWQPIDSDGRIRTEVVDDFIRWGREQKFITGEVPTSTWWNPSFLESPK